MAIACLLRCRSYALRFHGLDFYQFWAVGQAAARLGIEDPYTDEARSGIGPALVRALGPGAESSQLHWAEGRRRVLQTYSTPFLYASFGAFSSGDYERDDRRFVLLSLLGLAFAIVVLTRLLGYPWWGVGAAFVLSSAPFAPVLSDLRVGNVSQVQLAMLAGALFVLIRPTWRFRAQVFGGVLGLAICFKPNLLLVAMVLTLVWIANRRYRKAVDAWSGIGAGLAAAVLFSSMRFHSLSVWRSWVVALRDIPEEFIPVSRGNFSLTRLLSQAIGVDLGVPLAIATLAGIFACAWIGRRRSLQDPDRDREAIEDIAAAGAGCLVTLLAARLVWVHYFVLALPSVLLALRPSGTLRRVLGLGAYLLISGVAVERVIGTGHPEILAWLGGGGILLLLALTAGELLFRPRFGT